MHSRADAVGAKAYEAAIMAARGEQPTPTLSELVESWINVHAATASRAHLRTVEAFGRLHLHGMGNMPIGSIRTDIVEPARAAHLAAHAPASANQWLRILKLLMNWAVRRELLPAIPWRVRVLKVQKKPRPILPIAKAKEWMQAVDQAAAARPGVALVVCFMLGLGLRISEAIGAQWEWIDWERETYTPGVTKGREADPVPVPEWVLSRLTPIRCEKGLIARSPKGKRIHPEFVRQVMVAANEAAGTPGITPHRLRGTYATLLSRSGLPLQDIQKVMRHKDPMTTIGYLERNTVGTKEAADRIAREMGFEREIMTNDAPPAHGIKSSRSDSQSCTSGTKEPLRDHNHPEEAGNA